MRSACLLLAGLGVAGCASVGTMQTASTTPAGTYRLGGSASFAGWCSVSVDPARNCDLTLARNWWLPELRGIARRGLTESLDVGVAVHAQGVLQVRGMSDEEVSLVPGAGLSVDVKKELVSWRHGSGARSLFSVAPGVGGWVFGPVLGVDLSLPLHYGHQTRSAEWVAGVQLIERFLWSGPSSSAREDAFGLLVAVHGRGRVRPGVQLAYRASYRVPLGGTFIVSAGLFVDLSPSP